MHPWRRRLETILGPLARKSPVSPNVITIVGLMMNLLAAVIMGFAWWDCRLFLAVPVLVGIAGLADGLDGLVARFQGKASLWGDFLDHLSDRLSDTALAAGWLVGTGVRIPIALLAVIVVSLTGYVGTQTEATFGVREYGNVGRGEFVLTLFILPLIAYILARSGLSDTRFAGFTVAEGIAVFCTFLGTLVIIHRVRRAAHISSESEQDGD